MRNSRPSTPTIFPTKLSGHDIVPRTHSELEKVIHEQGLVSVLKQIHDDLDAAVFEAYGWPATLTDEEILERLVALRLMVLNRGTSE